MAVEIRATKGASVTSKFVSILIYFSKRGKGWQILYTSCLLKRTLQKLSLGVFLLSFLQFDLQMIIIL